MKYLYSSSFIRLDSFHDQCIEVTLSESKHRCRVIHLKTFIRIFYTVTVLYLSEIYLFVYLFYLFVLFTIYLINYIVYRKEKKLDQKKSREKAGREYAQISQIIKNKCYL